MKYRMFLVSIFWLVNCVSLQAAQLFQGLAGAGCSLMTHELGHHVTTWMTGGKIVGVKVNGVKVSGGDEKVISIGGFASQFLVANVLYSVRDKSMFFKSWYWLSVLDLPGHVLLSYLGDKGDITNSGLKREVFILGAVLEILFFWSRKFWDRECNIMEERQSIEMGFYGNRKGIGCKIFFKF